MTTHPMEVVATVEAAVAMDTEVVAHPMEEAVAMATVVVAHPMEEVVAMAMVLLKKSALNMK